MYQALQSIMLDSEVEETKDTADEEEVLTVTFHRNTEEAPEVTLKYFAYDDTYDSLEINGTERFLVKAEDVDELVKQIKKGDSAINRNPRNLLQSSAEKHNM